MKKYFQSILLGISLLTISSFLSAQNTEDTIPESLGHKDSFENFRKEIKGNFHLFRKNILDNYADFLETTWKEFNSFRGKERYTIPKLQNIPKVAPDDKRPTDSRPILPHIATTPPQVSVTPPLTDSHPLPIPSGAQTDTLHFYARNIYSSNSRIKVRLPCRCHCFRIFQTLEAFGKKQCCFLPHSLFSEIC